MSCIDRDRNALDEGDVVEDAAGLLWLVRNDGLNAVRLAADREGVRNAGGKQLKTWTVARAAYEPGIGPLNDMTCQQVRSGKRSSRFHPSRPTSL